MKKFKEMLSVYYYSFSQGYLMSADTHDTECTLSGDCKNDSPLFFFYIFSCIMYLLNFERMFSFAGTCTAYIGYIRRI